MGSQTVGYERATEQQKTRSDPRDRPEENTKLIHTMGHYKLIRKGRFSESMLNGRSQMENSTYIIFVRLKKIYKTNQWQCKSE